MLIRILRGGASTMPAMKVDFYYPPSPPQGASSAALEAADLGYDGFFSSETQYDPFFPLAFAGREGTSLDLGTAIAVAFPRSPMVTAMTSWDLARLSSGRFILGLGTQIRAHITRRFSTEWGSPGPRLRDYIMALRAIWDTWQNATPLRYDGEFYKFTLMTPFFDPGPLPSPNIPIYIAGVGPYLSKLAGEVCDGFFVHPFHTARYLDKVVIPNVAAGASAASRALADIDLAANAFVMTGSTQAEIEEAMEPVRQQISFYASTPSYRHVLEANGWDFGEELNAMSKRGQWAEMPSVVPDEAVLEVGVAAPLDKLGDAIKDRYGDRIQRIGFYAVGSGATLHGEDIRDLITQLHG
jgi:probable F420-dependent oxidoreductase